MKVRAVKLYKILKNEVRKGKLMSYNARVVSLYAFFFVFFSGNARSETSHDGNIHFVAVIPSYNNEQWAEKNLDSIFSQNYPHFRVIYINDASQDRTGEIVKAYLKNNNLEHKCTYIENNINRGALYNLYHAIHTCEDKEVVVMLDGDDWLTNSHVLTRVSQEYKHNKVWLTYGQYQQSSTGNIGCCDYIDDNVVTSASFRTDRWKTSHLRTFYAKLFKLIQPQDLIHEGRFFKVAWDLAMMFPMLEMAQERHSFIPDVLYVYNIDNVLNDFKLYSTEQERIDNHVRYSMRPYERIESLF
jgi:glycosyltransferase involved in cell wall biosynthesis